MSQLKIENLSKHSIYSEKVGELEYYYIKEGKGDALLFLHGFPDLANTWDHSIDHFSKTHSCMAPFLKGYYPSSLAPDGDYHIKGIAEELGMLMEKLGFASYVVIGQDWGASIAYAMANLFPERVKKLVTVAIPHPAYIKLDLFALWKARHFLRFRNAGSSLNYTRKKDMSYIDRLIRRWSPQWEDAHELSQMIRSTFALEGRLEAALGYYWCFNEALQDREKLRFYARRPTMPLLTLAGKTDGSVQLKNFYKMRDDLRNEFRLEVHPTAGHFLHREAPGFFIEKVEEFISE